MLTLLRPLTFAVLILTLSACAIGNKHSYHDITANLQAQGATAIAVTTHDQRPYIMSGNKRADFVGLQRGGYGQPFNVSTVSGKPLDHDMTQSVVNSLNVRGFQATPVAVSSGDNVHTVVAKLKETMKERLLVLTLKEWKSDTMNSTALIYDVKVMVMDRAGNILGESAVSGRDNLSGNFWNPPEHAREAVPLAFKEKLEELLNSPQIVAALR